MHCLIEGFQYPPRFQGIHHNRGQLPDAIRISVEVFCQCFPHCTGTDLKASRLSFGTFSQQ
jgi:hypothetical protein